MLNLIRCKATDSAILGKIYLNGAFVCFSLENKSKAVPCGVYNIENSKSPKFGRELPLIHNDEVSASRGIRIHVCNTSDDVAGCIGVGMKLSGAKMVESKAAETMVTMICRNTYQLTISEI